jgi:tetratricopeptide (TPR) repeat protein
VRASVFALLWLGAARSGAAQPFPYADLSPESAEAARLFEAGRLREAEARLESLAQHAPQRAEGWFQLGLLRAARGRYRAAADAQRLALARQPGFGQAYCALALDLRESGQSAEGLQAAGRAVELLPDYAGAWNLRANLRRDLGDRDGALADYVRALQLQPRYTGAWINWAQLQADWGRKDEALRGFSSALQADPSCADAWLARGELNLERHALDAAAADFQAASRLAGYEAEGFWGLARVEKARKRREEEEKDLGRYRSAVRRRDKRLEAEKRQGLESPSTYEPGLPLPLRPSAGTLHE